jgi:hypothetical protein
MEIKEEHAAKASHNHGLVWIVAIIIVLGGLAYTVGKPVVTQHAQSAHPAQSTPVTADGHSLYGKPSLTAAQVNAILSAYHSPAAGQGQTLYDLSAQYGIDDAYPLAFFMHESDFGTQGMATITHSIGNLRCIDDAACVNTQGGQCESGQSCYAAFPSFAAGANAWFALITSSLYKGDGLTTVESIIPRYAPSADDNDEQAYISSILYCVSSWQSGKVVVG